MGLVLKKVICINSYEEEDGVVICQVIVDDLVVLEFVIFVEVVDKEEFVVIMVFLVNDGYGDDELDEVFLEEYFLGIDVKSVVNLFYFYSSDVDFEILFVSSLLLK